MTSMKSDSSQTTANVAAAEVSKRPWHVYRTTLISTMVVIGSTLGVYVLGVLAPIFTEELGIKTSELGIFTSSMFITAGLVSIPAGWIADRSRVSLLAAIQLLVSGASIALLAFSNSLLSIVLLCVLMGAITAMHGPLSNRTVAGYVTAQQFKFVIGWRSLGPQIGSLLVGVVVAPFLDISPWRMVVAVLGIVIAATAIPLFIGIRSGDRYVRNQHEIAGTKPVVGPKITRPPTVVWWLMTFGFFSSGAVITIATFLPSFAVESFGMTLTAAGAAAGVVAVSSLIGRGIWIKLLTETNEKLLLGAGALSAAMALLFLSLSPSIGPVAFWIAAVLTGATALGTSPLSQIVLMRHCPPSYIGRASALTGMTMYATSILQPILFGIVAANWGLQAGWLVVGSGSLLGCLVMVVWTLRSRVASLSETASK